MTADNYVKVWLLKAENDLRLAAHELKLDEEEMITEAICFHCQQAAEKFLKAHLISYQIEFNRSHDLEYLVELCAKADKDFMGLEVGNLTDYAVGVRYPDEFYCPSPAEAKDSFRIASAIKKLVLSKLPVQ
jgi:HEPN domain-containing protein